MRWLSLPKIILLATAFSAGVFFGIYKNHQTSYNNVVVHLPKNVKASIYKDLGGDGPFNYDKNKPLIALQPSQSVKLKRGVYDVVINDPANQYTNPVIKKSVDYGTREISVELNYTDEKLNSLLPEVSSSAQAAIYAAHPSIKQGYIIAKEHLYGLGDWYGAELQPKDPAMDNLKVILRLDNSSWKMAIDDPTISIGQPSNPDIPFEVIKKVDQL
jgi:hypothetical protein